MHRRREMAGPLLFLATMVLGLAIWLVFLEAWLACLVTMIFFAFCLALGLIYSFVCPGPDQVIVKRSFFFRKAKVFRTPTIVLPEYHDYCVVDLGEKQVRVADLFFWTKNGVFQVAVVARMQVKDDDAAILALTDAHGADFNSERIDSSFHDILEKSLRKVLDEIHGFAPGKTDVIALRTVSAVSTFCQVSGPATYALFVEVTIEKLEQNP